MPINHLLRERKLAAGLRQALRFDPQRISIRLRSGHRGAAVVGSPSLPATNLRPLATRFVNNPGLAEKKRCQEPFIDT